MSKFLLINKPENITSHDVVDYVRKITNEKKVGHAGTLDPFATGLLIVAIGRESTKNLNEFLKLDKKYRATLYFGAVSDTQDKTGLITNIENITPISKENLENVLKNFIGGIEQIPPMYSAKKINGKKLYELARQGKEIERKPNKITIYSIDLISYKWPRATINVHCQSGTYIRTLGADIGKTLKVGAYLETLIRTQIGKYSLKNAIDLTDLNSDNWKSYLELI